MGFLILLGPYACANIPTFPENGSPAIHHQTDFTALQSDPALYQGKEIRIAGRMVGIEQNDQGVLIRADWMLFPENPNLRPENPDPGTIGLSDFKKARFFIYYPGTIDETNGLWKGNEFLAIGKANGTRTLVDLVGFSQPVPYIHARCLHVWITGSTDLSEYTWADPLNFRYPPPLERTFCLNRKS